MEVERFVTAHLPHPGCRVLEVGCGNGELARALAAKGYGITAIDPEAPEGEPFQRISLEGFVSHRPFDAVVAVRSLHHIPALNAALEKIHGLTAEGGVLILEEFAWEQMNEQTARWYQQNVGERKPEVDSLLPGNFPAAWNSEHEGMHDSKSIRDAVRKFFEESLFEPTPYIAKYYLKKPELIQEETQMIRSRQIGAMGYRLVGRR